MTTKGGAETWNEADAAALIFFSFSSFGKLCLGFGPFWVGLLLLQCWQHVALYMASNTEDTQIDVY